MQDQHRFDGAPDISVLVCTFNRKVELVDLIDSILAQEGMDEFTFELIVVDNNSTDGTREVVEGFVERFPARMIHYLFEAKQGKSHALRTGVDTVRGPLLFVCDSDQILPPFYLGRVVQLFREEPNVSIVGGKVLPRWSEPCPAWLTEDHWPAIGMSTFGEKRFICDATKPLCFLVPAFRTNALRASGGFRTGLSVSKGEIGGVEDADLMQRMLVAGFQALYVPELWLYHRAERDRLTKSYHRRWHVGHGRFYSRWRDPAFEKSRFTIAGIPSHLFRSAARDAVHLLAALLLRLPAAFALANRLRFFWGFAWHRITQPRDTAPEIAPPAEGAWE